MSKFIKKCTYCQNEYKGRVDSIFCSISCRSNHWQRNKRALNGIKLSTENHNFDKRRKLYIADKGIGQGKNSPSVVTCRVCKENGEIGLFYTNHNQTYMRCDNCGITFQKN